MNHTCNQWCFDGLHALLFDSTIADRGGLEGVARNLATMAGGAFVSFDEVRPAGEPAPGSPTRYGVSRGRFVVWARGGGR